MIMDFPVYQEKLSIPGKFLTFKTEDQYVFANEYDTNCNEIIIILAYVTNVARVKEKVMIEIYGDSYTKFVFKTETQAQNFLNYFRDHLLNFYSK